MGLDCDIASSCGHFDIIYIDLFFCSNQRVEYSFCMSCFCSRMLCCLVTLSRPSIPVGPIYNCLGKTHTIQSMCKLCLGPVASVYSWIKMKGLELVIFVE